METCAGTQGLRSFRTYVGDAHVASLSTEALRCFHNHPSLEVLHFAGHDLHDRSSMPFSGLDLISVPRRLVFEMSQRRLVKPSLLKACCVFASMKKLRSLHVHMNLESAPETMAFVDMLLQLPALESVGPLEQTVTCMYDRSAWGINTGSQLMGDCHCYYTPTFSVWLEMMKLPVQPPLQLKYLQVFINSPNRSLLRDMVKTCVHRLPLLSDLPVDLYACDLSPQVLCELLSPLAQKQLKSHCGPTFSRRIRNLVVTFPENDRDWETEDGQVFHSLMQEVFSVDCKLSVILDTGSDAEEQLHKANFLAGYNPTNLTWPDQDSTCSKCGKSMLWRRGPFEWHGADGWTCKSGQRCMPHHVRPFYQSRWSCESCQLDICRACKPAHWLQISRECRLDRWTCSLQQR